MAEFNHSPTTVLEVNRCYDCGRYYAVERAIQQHCICPHCAGRKIAEHCREMEALRRSNNSIRGAIKRLKR